MDTSNLSYLKGTNIQYARSKHYSTSVPLNLLQT